MSGCQDCYFGGKKVGNRGPEDSPFVIVGESPGIMELYQGKPFVGPSGKVLTETIAKIFGNKDMPEDEWPIKPFYTNAIHCLPRKKEPENMATACQRCNPRLIDDLQKHPRKVILTLGNGALHSLMGNYNLKITRERGKLFKSPLASIGIVTAVHPAFLLRGNGNYTQFTQDLEYAITLMREGDKALKLPNGTSYSILETPEEVAKYAKGLKDRARDVAVDIETTGFDYRRDEILCLGMQAESKYSVIIPGHLITPELFENDCTQIYHNGKFDIKFLRHKGALKAFVHEDTMLLSYSLNERRGIHDLDQVASDWLGSPNHKHIVDPYVKGTIKWVDSNGIAYKRKRNYGDIPKDILYKYLALDINDTYHLKPILREKVREDHNLEKFYTKHLIEGSEYLTKVEMNGMRADLDQIAANKKEYSEKIKKHTEEINTYAINNLGHEINPNSPIQVKKLLYDALKLGSTSLSTDEKTLDTLPLLGDKKHPAVQSLLDYRESQKALSTYVLSLQDRPEKLHRGFIADDGRVHQSYLLHGTATSRLSCRDPNLQNIPRLPSLRGQFIPRDGYGILEVDYSQAELRSLACLSACPDLMGVFLRGEDLHVELSKFLFGENFTKEDKMKAKTVNFGIVYGRTAGSIAQAFNVTVSEAQSWIDGWFRRFPKAAEFIQKCRMAPVLNQTIITVFGNKKRPGVVSREKLNDLQNESANFPHQSIASNLTVRAGIELFDPLRDTYDTHIVNTVHDCIVTEVPLDVPTIQAAAKFIVDKMESIAPRYHGLGKVPFKAESEFGLRWGNLLKFKEIEQLYQWDLSKIPSHIAAH